MIGSSGMGDIGRLIFEDYVVSKCRDINEYYKKMAFKDGYSKGFEDGFETCKKVFDEVLFGGENGLRNDDKDGDG